MKILYATNLPAEELRLIGSGKKDITKDREHFLFPLIGYFYEQGDEIIIISTSREIERSEKYCIPHMTIKIVKLEKHGNISALLNFQNDIQRIKRSIQEEGADLYHAHWSYEYADACLKINPNKTIITVHDCPEKVCPAIGNFYWRRRLNLGNRVLRKGKNFTAVSPYIEYNIKKLNSGANVFMIPNCLCEDELEKYSSKTIAPNLQNDSFHILCVNNGFNNIKNTTTAMLAFERFHKKHRDVILNMYGDGYEQGGKADKWASEHLDTANIVFHGRKCRKEIMEAFRAADIFLHTSQEESFGLVYLEAMASETAIIAGKDSGATAWVLDNGKCGALVNVNCVQEIYDSLEKLYMSENLREEYRKRGKDRLRKHFMFAQNVLEYQHVYDQTLKQMES